MRQCRNYWTKKKCQEEASKYKSPGEFKTNNNYVYVKCFKNKWLDEFYRDFEIKRGIFWTKERCQEVALRFQSRKEFSNNFKSAYTISLRNRWLDDICLHMIRKPSTYWTKVRCQEESSKYKTITEFKKNSYQAHKYSVLNCWLDEICSHMKKSGNIYKRCIYAFEFPDKSVYVGLTYNIDKRQESHYKSLTSQVNKHIKLTDLQPELLKLTDYIDVELAKVSEGYFIQQYINKGWTSLNVQKPGNTGGNKKTTEEKCKDIVEKYDSLYLFRKEQPNIYRNIIRYNWKHLISNLSRNYKESGYWTKDKCQDIAQKYKSRIDFFKNDPSSYNISRKRGWLDEICSHMNTKTIKHKGYWTKISVIQESTKYRTKEEFKKGSPSAYVYYIKNRLSDSIHLEGRKKWTKKECLNLLNNCSSKKEVRNLSETLYRILNKNRWNIQDEVAWLSK